MVHRIHYVTLYDTIYYTTLRGAPHRPPLQRLGREGGAALCYDTPNLPTNIVDFRGFDSSTI